MTKRSQLESVAKDWCETIRASQVIPVYPLTEDIQPGDVFLVQVPVDRQQEIYRRKGFLPLDNHITRLHPRGYGSFYDHSFAPDSRPVSLPLDWIRPNGGTADAWADAPNAAFPTYSFTVSRSGGLNLALPISGVPVGLSLLGTDSATGSVSIKRARTLGVDTVSLYENLERWASGQRTFLANFGTLPGDPPHNYLRVITRIYTTGELDVQLNDARSVGGGLDAGLARPVDLFLPTLPDNKTTTREAARDSYDRGLAHLNNMANARGTPMYTSGDDSGLTAEELAVRAKAREEELKKLRESAETELATKKELAAKARDDGKTETEALRTAQVEYGAANRELAIAERELWKAQGTLEQLPPEATEEERAAARTAVDEARKKVDTAKGVQQKKETALATARTAYAPKGDAIAKADVQAAATAAALERVKGFAPGASFRFNAASARSVSMTETFTPPLTIGYLAFDVPVLAGGGLGRPIPTHAVLDPAFGIPQESGALVMRQMTEAGALGSIYTAISRDPGPTARSIRRSLDDLVRYLPKKFQEVRSVTEEGKEVRGAYQLVDCDLALDEDGSVNFLDYNSFRPQREESLRKLQRIRDQRLLRVKNKDGKWVSATKADYRTLDKHVALYEERLPERQSFSDAQRALLAYYARTASTRP